jgi:hypothetical protein
MINTTTNFEIHLLAQFKRLEESERLTFLTSAMFRIKSELKELAKARVSRNDARVQKLAKMYIEYQRLQDEYTLNDDIRHESHRNEICTTFR